MTRLILLALLFSFISFLTSPIQGGDSKNNQLNWQKYDVAAKKAKEESKHLVVRFTTKWCGWCKKMAATTYSDSSIAATLNNYFELAVVDGDSYNLVSLEDGDITERGLTKQYGVRGYPTTWFLKPAGEKIAPVTGYISAEQMQYILDFVRTTSYDKMSFKEFVEKEKAKQH